MEEKNNAEAIWQAIEEAVQKVEKALIDFIDSLEPYQKYEILHPKKKPRGSIRRIKKERREDDRRRTEELHR
jgi:hypothetical protein